MTVDGELVFADDCIFVLFQPYAKPLWVNLGGSATFCRHCENCCKQVRARSAGAFGCLDNLSDKIGLQQAQLRAPRFEYGAALLPDRIGAADRGNGCDRVGVIEPA